VTFWEAVTAALPSRDISQDSDPIPRYGEPILVTPRLGQGAFRVLVTDVYHRRCAITGEKTLPALDAAHIRPYADGGEHAARNGLLLRRDVHSLFDAGYVTVTPELHFEVSGRIREEFENGRHYYALHGHKIERPDQEKFWPDKAALTWHNENRFRG
jgi:putative restriction endonuclease